MLPWESSQTPWVLPYLMVRGSSPQSWMASYRWSPCPRMGGLAPALSVARRKAGADAAAAAVTRKLRRVTCMVGTPDESVVDFVVRHYKEASQTHEYCVAKNATHRAARPDPSLRKERLFRMKKQSGSLLSLL